MTQSLIAALQTAAKQAEAKASAAATRQRQAEAALASAVAASDDAARRRRVLDDAMLQAQAAEDASRDRLGHVRLQLAGTERQIEAEGDRAASGSDAAAKAIPRLEDTRALQSQLVRAHERRTQEAEAAREAAEQALAEHDAAELARVAALLEDLLTDTAQRTDDTLALAANLVVEVNDLVQARERLTDGLGRRRSVSWRPELLHGGRAVLEVFRNATSHAGAPIGGPTTIRGLPVGKSTAGFVADAVAYWDAVGGADLSPPRKESSVPGLEFHDDGVVLMHGEAVGRIVHDTTGKPARSGKPAPPWLLELLATAEASAVVERHDTQAAARERAEKLLSAPTTPSPSSKSPARKFVPIGDDPNDAVEVAA